MQYKNLIIEKIFHAGIKIKNKKIIYIDPLNLPANSEPANFVLITHEHLDHCSPDDIKKVSNENTTIITISMCAEKIADLETKEIKYIKPFDALNLVGMKITAMPAYNINKFRSPGVPFHPQEDGKVGFVLEIDKIKIYHAGDTDNIPEMANLKNVDIAFLPVSGIFTMTPEEAAEAASIIRPNLAVPIHYGDFEFGGRLVGEKENGKIFKKLSTVPVEII